MMSVRREIAGFGVFLALTLAGAAQASIVKVDFTVNPGQWVADAGSPPYGLSSNPTLTGSVTLNSALAGSAKIVDFTYVTGTRTWTMADLTPASGAFFFGNTFGSFDLVFTGNNYVYSNNTAALDDGLGNRIFCNACVSIDSVTAVPEPDSWALLIAGFGLTGAVLRRRRSAVPITA